MFGQQYGSLEVVEAVNSRRQVQPSYYYSLQQALSMYASGAQSERCGPS